MIDKSIIVSVPDSPSGHGCLAATKGACDNKTLVRRTLAEKVILGAVKDQISDREQIAYVLNASKKRSRTCDRICRRP